MSESETNVAPPRVIVIADIESNAQALVERVLKPAGIQAWIRGAESPPPDVLLIDVTQLRGDPLANLRNFRSTGDDSPAILLAAHFPLAKIRELFRLGVSDFLLKPYRPDELRDAIYELSEIRSTQTNTKSLATRVDGLREQLRRRSEEIRMLSEIGRTVVNLEDLNGILMSVVEAASFVTDAEEANIYLANPESKELVLRASKQAGERNATLQKIRVNDTLVGEVYNSGQPVLRQPSLDAGPVKVQTGFLVQSTVNVPLRVKNHVVGVLGVYNRLTPRTFNEHHLTLLTALSDWAGVALEQASLKRGTPSEVESPQMIQAASPDLWLGIDQTIGALQKMVTTGEAALSPKTEAELAAALGKLKEIRSMPVAMLDSGQAADMIDLPGLIKDVVNEMQQVAGIRKLDIIAEQIDTIPLFRGENGTVRQVLEALVSAAIRRTKKGRIVLEAHTFEILKSQSEEFPLTVNVEMHDGAWAAVRVSDSSSGLSPDTVQAITESKINPGAGQMGPGLSMGEIRMIVESMNGVMWYEHTPASTSITFALPMV
ncbi:MAG: GAF domain-containing sensor histidine kinase [Anaerolineales bacterium]